MSKATYEAMSRKKLRDYLRQNRNNDEAWEVFFDKLEKTKDKVSFPYTENPQEVEKNLREFIEHKRNSQ